MTTNPLNNYYTANLESFEPYLEKIGNVHTYYPGDNIIKSHLLSGNQYVHYIKNGFVKISATQANGKDKTMLFIGAGSLFPNELATENIHIQAVTKLTVLNIPPSKIRQLMLDLPNFHFSLTQSAVDIANRIAESCAYKPQTSENSLTKICNFFVLYCQVMKSNIIELTQEEIANACNLCRTNVARQLQLLKNSGYLTIRTKKINLIDMRGIMQYCS